ncbi:MAG: hypothetical protein ACXW03_01590 [Methylobacter sp.]
MLGKLLYIFNRLREPSSHAAIAAMLAMFGQTLPLGAWETLVNGGAVVFGILGVFAKEGKPETVVKGF